jgi:hypothetical protein
MAGGAKVLGSSTPNVLNNKLWSCSFRDRGIIKIGVGLAADVMSRTVFCDTITVNVSLGLSWRPGTVVGDNTFLIKVGVEGKWYYKSVRKNFVAWTKPGTADSTIDRTNLAGRAPMEWAGWAWKALQLGDRIVVYGEHGISLMSPYSEPISTFGFETLGEVGIKGAYAVDGSKHIHYFISELGDLWRITDKGPELLGYREIFEDMSDPVLMYDEQEDRLYIANEAVGYCYDTGLGGGYSILSGISRGIAVSPFDLTVPAISIMTDILDLGHRGLKQITFIEVGTDSDADLYVAVDFRYRTDEAWRTSEWTLCSPEGVARLTITGVEFRLRVKQLVSSELSIDYINVRHQRGGKRFLRGPLFEQPERSERE